MAGRCAASHSRTSRSCGVIFGTVLLSSLPGLDPANRCGPAKWNSRVGARVKPAHEESIAGEWGGATVAERGRASARLLQRDGLLARQGIPGFDIGAGVADPCQELALIVIAPPAPAAVNPKKRRAPRPAKPAPPRGDPPKTQTFVFPGQAPPQRNAIDDDAIR